MRHILEESQTRRFLEEWAQTTLLCRASFFFWNSGSREQKSQVGCLKALLSQILQRYPDLVPIVLPERWADLYSNLVRRSTPSILPWTLRGLIAEFRTLVRQDKISVRLFILVDGLDELDSDHDELVDMFKEIATNPNIKTCISSRPWLLFRNTFCDCPSLRLQDLTYNDIHHYVEDRFRSNDSFHKLMGHEQQSAAALISDVVERADGVFLWVRLVVKSLLNGLRNLDDVAILQERLRLIPREMDSLYTHLLGLIDPVYLPWASRAFQILRVSRELESHPFGPRENATNPKLGVLPLTLDAFYLAMDDESRFDDSPHLTPDLLKTKFRDAEIRLTGRCAGLLEVSRTGHQGPLSSESTVDYFHRTARDYLENDTIWSEVLQHTAKTNFSPYSALLKAYASMLSVKPTHKNVILPLATTSSKRNKMIPYEKMITSALIYAYHSDKMGVFSNMQAFWLDEMNERLTARWNFQRYLGNELSLFNVHRKTENDILIFESFLDLAAAYQLASYVERKLAAKPRPASVRKASQLLQLSLPFRERDICADLPNPRAEMISVLLRHGAKPNVQYSRFTAWENTLHLLHIVPVAHKNTTVNLLEVARLLLGSGAEPMAALNSGTVTAWEIFVKLRNHYPELVKHIQAELVRLAPDLISSTNPGPEECSENAPISEGCADDTTE